MSTKPVAQKLLIKKGFAVLIIDEPEGYRETLGALPEDVTVSTNTSALVDFAQIFVTDMEGLRRTLIRLKGYVKRGGLIWVTYPKGTSQLAKDRKVDVNRDIIARYAQGHRLQPVAMVSLDETWSALRLKML